MKRALIVLLLLTGSAYLSKAQIVDFTGIDIETQTTVKVADPNIRPTGFNFGVGMGVASVSLGEGFPSPTAANLCLHFCDWQITPQVEWNIFHYDFFLGAGGGFNICTQFYYYFSPKIKSLFISGKIGYNLGFDDIKVDDNYANTSGLAMGYSLGYAWKSFKLEVCGNWYTVDRCIDYDHTSSMIPTVVVKATYVYTLGWQ